MAAKIISKANLQQVKARKKLGTEIRIHRNLSKHRNILTYRHHFEDSQNFYILTEICCSGTLSELLKRRKRLHEFEVRCYVRQICEGLKHMHRKKVIHRDLKLGNLFLDRDLTLKIGDFGLSCELDYLGQQVNMICGTPNYIAPEVIEGSQGYSQEVDVWAVGVIMFTLLTGRPPFEAQTLKKTYLQIKSNEWRFPTDIPISSAAIDLVKRILIRDPTYRLNVLEVENHPFLNGPGVIPKALCPSLLINKPSLHYIDIFEKATPNDVLQCQKKQMGEGYQQIYWMSGIDNQQVT